MATSTTSDLQVIPFHNCEGCIGKVKRAVHKFNGLRLIEMDPENGIFTISTIDQPEAIRTSLQQTFHMTGMLMTSSQAERIRSVECRHDVLRVHYYEKQPIISTVAPHFEDVSGFVAPPPTTKPSAPPIQMAEGYAYGHPVGSYGHSTTSRDNYSDSCCAIM